MKCNIFLCELSYWPRSGFTIAFRTLTTTSQKALTYFVLVRSNLCTLPCAEYMVIHVYAIGVTYICLLLSMPILSSTFRCFNGPVKAVTLVKFQPPAVTSAVSFNS